MEAEGLSLFAKGANGLSRAIPDVHLHQMLERG